MNWPLSQTAQKGYHWKAHSAGVGASLLHCFWLPKRNNGPASKWCSRGCSLTLVTNQPTLVPLLFGTTIPTSLNNFFSYLCYTNLIISMCSWCSVPHLYHSEVVSHLIEQGRSQVEGKQLHTMRNRPTNTKLVKAHWYIVICLRLYSMNLH